MPLNAPLCCYGSDDCRSVEPRGHGREATLVARGVCAVARTLAMMLLAWLPAARVASALPAATRWPTWIIGLALPFAQHRVGLGELESPLAKGFAFRTIASCP